MFIPTKVEAALVLGLSPAVDLQSRSRPVSQSQIYTYLICVTSEASWRGTLQNTMHRSAERVVDSWTFFSGLSEILLNSLKSVLYSLHLRVYYIVILAPPQIVYSSQGLF